MASCVECLHYNVCYKKPIRNVDTELVMIGGCSDYKPTADVEEVRHGEWVFSRKEWGSSDYSQDVYYKCSICGKEYEEFDIDEANYCSNCGAKMGGGKENER